MEDINKKVLECMKDFTTFPTQKEFKNKFPNIYKEIKNKNMDYNQILINIGYDPYKSGLKNYNYLSDDEMYESIRLSITDFIEKYSYIPNEQIYKILPLPSLQYLKSKYDITYSMLLKKINCDKIHGFKIYRHVPNDVLLKGVKTKVEDYLKKNEKLPNKKAFNELKIGTVNFYEARFQKSYYDLLESLGFSLSMKHKPLVYKDYTDEEIFELTRVEIQKFIDDNNSVPTQYQYRKLNAPSEIYFKRKYNLTYNELLLKLDFEPVNTGEKYKYMDDKEVFEKLRDEINAFVMEKDKLPSAEEFLLLDVPSLGYIKKRYGFTYKNLVINLGYKETDFINGYFGFSEEEIFSKVREVIETYIKDNSKLPTQKQFNTLDVPSAYLIKRIYGLTYSQLIKKLDIK